MAVIGIKEVKNNNEFVRKYAFVKAINEAAAGNISDVESVEYELWYEPEKDWAQEFIVMHYKGGAIAVENNNMNSLSATFRNIGKLMDGGYYAQVGYYKSFTAQDNWKKVIFD